MESQQIKPVDLLGKHLSSFSIEEYTEVYMVNTDGRKTKSHGFFKDENTAKAFAQNQTDADYFRTEKTFILADGKIGFALGESVTLVDDEQIALDMKEKALQKLSPEERKILGL